MSWTDRAVFYHIYPLGLTGAPQYNEYGETVHRIHTLYPWIDHLCDFGFNALYIGPLFESVGHGYETTDYRKVDRRLGTNEDLKEFIQRCHEKGIKVILDGVFNHTGRDFFAFRDIREKRENSPFVSWYCNVNFYGNNRYNDGFSYDTWGGHDSLAKLNHANPDVRNYLLDSIHFWIDEFAIDGLRLDAADVLDFNFMRELRARTQEWKEDFWLMGEVIHGDYSRWVNDNTLHSVTNYHLHKALYSGHNDHNYFEIAHTIRRMNEIFAGRSVRLYNFADNHDVERIYTILRNKAHYTPLHILLYTLPGIPSVYYGSEYGIEGKKERHSDISLRPALNLEEMKENACSELIRALGKIRRNEQALFYGEYQEVSLTTRQYVFRRGDVIICVNNDEQACTLEIQGEGQYTGALYGSTIQSDNNRLRITIPGCSGEIYIPFGHRMTYEPVKRVIQEKQNVTEWKEPVRSADPHKPYEEMSVEELQAEILAKMAANGPVTERMKQDVRENIYRDSLLNWVRSFR